jgi:hypothetical protein
MKHDMLDSILRTEETLEPSSGFLAGVMERVQEESITPPPIPFPWKRAMPGYLAAAVTLVWGGIVFAHSIPQLETEFSALLSDRRAISLSQPEQTVAWIVLALGISLASWLISRRMVGQSRLL